MNELHSYELHSGEELVMISVFSENGKAHLDRQAVLKITNQSTHDVVWKTTDDQSEAGLGLPFGKYEIEISAVGYLSERKEFLTATREDTVRLEVALQRDPEAADFNIAEAAMPSKARKEAKHGVSALKSGKLKDARKRLDAAYKLAPSSSDLNYLLGYLFYQQNNLGQARSYLEAASNLDPRHVQALTLLGRVDLIQEDYQGATAALEKAVRAHSGYWMAHNLLADAYLKQRKYEEARQQAELAIANGKAGASTANLVLGEALVNLGKKEEGIQALKAFVQDSPKNPVVPQVRDLIATLEGSGAGSVRDADTTRKNATPSSGVDPLLATPELGLSVKPWRPEGIDETKPPVAAGVSCPYENVMEMSGSRAKELADNVSRIAANEHLLHKRVDEMGNPATTKTRDYDYMASLSEEKQGFVAVDEQRSERQSSDNIPEEIGDTTGFAGLALVFHPSKREDFEMTCEGLGRWHEQAAWLVHFKEREGRPTPFQLFVVGGQSFPMRLKGRAWIAADNFQIVRIESELLSPVPELQLISEQQVVEYGPVPFPSKNLELWLPKSAEIYLDYHKHHYYRKHSYDHYMLFSVDSEEKRKEPKAQ
jgi:tetratricopeptide (TPR) repeat protein